MARKAAVTEDGPLGPEEIEQALAAWRLQARIEQLPPDGAWRVWVFLGGRGAGKTRAGAEWVRAAVLRGAAHRVALVGATERDVREVMVGGRSGLLATPGARFEASHLRVTWPNGATAQGFSAERPNRLRGPEFDLAWADEFAAWRSAEALSTLRLALRLGTAPRLMVTTTPRPTPALRALLAEPGVAVTHAGMRRNLGNLPGAFVSHADRLWGAGAFGRQEIEGEMLEEEPGALWTRADIEAVQVERAPPLDRIVVAVDPPSGAGPDSDACGIIGAGAHGEGEARRAVVLADASVQGAPPAVWAARATSLADSLKAQAIIAEVNQGGEMVRTVLRVHGAQVPVRLLHARTAKRRRAEPVRALYDRGLVTHAGRFPALEDEMRRFGGRDFTGSPDRLDALVWALTDLMLDAGSPRVRAL